jgi:Zn finger protein HypA/HybF involved in hydrogenase expression
MVTQTKSNEYQCLSCEHRFQNDGSTEISCPQCGNTKRDEFAEIYAEDDAELAEFFNEEDIQAGD